MTCVWRALAAAVNVKWTAKKFAQYLLHNNVLAANVCCDRIFPTEAQQRVNQQSISDNVKANRLHKGYNMAGGDPVLFLVCQLFRVSIRCSLHDFVCHYEYVPPLRIEFNVVDAVVAPSAESKNPLTRDSTAAVEQQLVRLFVSFDDAPAIIITKDKNNKTMKARFVRPRGRPLASFTTKKSHKSSGPCLVRIPTLCIVSSWDHLDFESSYG